MIPTRTPAKSKSTKALSDARNILPDKIGLFLQRAKENDFKSICTDIWERCFSNKIYIFDSKMNKNDSVKMYVKYSGILGFALKRKKQYVL